MDVRLLRAFVAVADAGHYGSAAAKLFVTQSTLSKQIQSLELAVGGPLFERGRHGARPTPLGLLLRREAQALLRLSDQIDIKMHRANAGLTGTLDIGFGISTLVAVPQLIAGFRLAAPDTQITLNDLPSNEQHQRLLEGRLDVGFCRAPETSRDLAFIPVMEERLALVVQGGMRPPTMKELPALNALGFVALSPARGRGLDAQIAKWCLSARFQPRITQHSDDILTVHAVVAAGLGAALLPFHGVAALGASTERRPLSGPSARWKVGMCWRRANEDPLLLRFIEHVSKHSRAIG